MSSDKPKAGGLPNPYAAIAKGRLPNPYASLASGAEDTSAKLEEEQPQPEEKKAILNVLQFHNPHSIKRPQPPQKKPILPRAPQPLPQAAIEMAAPDIAKVVSQQRSIDYYRNTEADDEFFDENRREQNRLRAQEKKRKDKYLKRFGGWDPDKGYAAVRNLHADAYEDLRAWEDKNHEFMGRLARDGSGAANSPQKDLHPQFAPPPFEEPRGKSPFMKAANPQFAAPSFNTPSTSSPRLPAPQYNAPPPTVHRPTQPVASSKLAVDPAANQKILLAQEKARQMAAAIKAKCDKLAAEKRAATSPQLPSPPPPPPPMELDQTPVIVPPPPAAKPYSHIISAPPVTYSHVISAPPVHYARPAPVEKDDASINQRPAKKQKVDKTPKPTKAALMMAKMGYVKGQGLGKNSDGVTTHLEVKMRKDPGGRQVRDDFGDDTKAIKSQQVFDITGGIRTKPEDYGLFGEPSRVIVAFGCVDGVDFDLDAGRDDGGIRQEIGDVFNAKFGPVERIHINLSSASLPVYIQFQDPLCALNAVNRFYEGYEFQGRKIRAHFYDEPKFNHLVYDH